ncbi:DUF484 family protein [Enterovibrio nigricans]|uniref:DUF484 domain-containing protein n=1 Tax=Enterovibrio nigricans DSM 22720 TaxID=1121868 RepID=A0A1T4U9R1_9GAMM|nr:DUF484 family protein [Enterovibrio nigricans]SKA49434.1 hypothetical protein SAMN02745132_01127 [Enterovibrio nigricans DSM 22720]
MTELSKLDRPLIQALSDDAVVSYLKDNPDFFIRQPEMAEQLRIPHAERGVISLVEIQLGRLRERVANLEEDITQLMSIAAGNEKLFRAFAEAHRALFAANREEDIHKALRELAASLNLNVSLRLFETGHHALNRKSVDAVKAAHFCGQRIYLGRLRKTDGEHFISQAPELGSYALVPVSQHKDLGFLAFASRDGGHFQPSMDTLFVEQVAEHIGILLTKWQAE